MNYIHGYPHSKKAEFYKLLLDYDDSLERDLADYGTIWYESGTRNLMVGDYRMPGKISSMVISKYFGFIKWLVDNDKIDRDKKEIEKSDYDITFTGALSKDKKSDLDIMVDTLLMLLSISDTPIEDLISYLK